MSGRSFREEILARQAHALQQLPERKALDVSGDLSCHAVNLSSGTHLAEPGRDFKINGESDDCYPYDSHRYENLPAKTHDLIIPIPGKGRSKP
jgi:hypothetical protein